MLNPEYSNITYSKESVDVNLRRWWNYWSCDNIFVFVNENRRKKKLCCLSFCNLDKTFGNLNKYILSFGKCEWETKEIVSINMSLLVISFCRLNIFQLYKLIWQFRLLSLVVLYFPWLGFFLQTKYFVGWRDQIHFAWIWYIWIM